MQLTSCRVTLTAFHRTYCAGVGIACARGRCRASLYLQLDYIVVEERVPVSQLAARSGHCISRVVVLPFCGIGEVRSSVYSATFKLKKKEKRERKCQRQSKQISKSKQEGSLWQGTVW